MKKLLSLVAPEVEDFTFKTFTVKLKDKKLKNGLIAKDPLPKMHLKKATELQNSYNRRIAGMALRQSALI